MEAFYAYCYGTSAWLSLQAIPLIISPTMICTLLSAEVHQPNRNSGVPMLSQLLNPAPALELYFARSLGVTQLAFSILFLFLTGVFPLSSSATSISDASTTTSPADAYSQPTILVSMLYHSTLAFYTYARFNRTNQFAFILATISSASLAAMGLWCILFAGDMGGRSKRTGADKRTSGWPFGNLEADKKRLGKKAR